MPGQSPIQSRWWRTQRIFGQSETLPFRKPTTTRSRMRSIRRYYRAFQTLPSHKMRNQMMTQRRMVLVLMVVLVSCGPRVGVAQEPLDWSGLSSPEECTQAEERLRGAPPDQARFRAMHRLSACGPRGGVLVAQQMPMMRSSTDTASLKPLVQQFLWTRDANILQAAVQLAADRSATLEARTGAIMIIVTQAHPRFRTDFSDYVLRDGPQVSGAVVGPALQLQGTPFPQGWEARADSMLSRVMADPTESEEMRWAANRGRAYLRGLGPGEDPGH